MNGQILTINTIQIPPKDDCSQFTSAIEFPIDIHVWEARDNQRRTERQPKRQNKQDKGESFHITNCS